MVMNTLTGNILPKKASAVSAAGAPTSIAQKLKTTRKEYGLTQQQVADLAGVSDRTVRKLEQGETSPSLKALLAVAVTLGLEVQVVLP